MMRGENWSVSGKLCDSCKTSSASLFCQADSVFLCMGCDSKVHSASKLASRHARVWVCEVCERAPASVTCKADAAALCAACDHDIHSANPLASRHERHPIIPFYESAATAKSVVHHNGGLGMDDGYFTHLESGGGEAEEAEAASWLLPNPKPNQIIDSPDLKSTEYFFSDMDPYLDMDIISRDQKPHHHQQQYNSGADCVVPVQSKNFHQPQAYHPPLVDGFPTYDVDYSGSKPAMYNFNSHSISQSVSSSSHEVGVVPDHNAMADVSNTFPRSTTPAAATSDAVSNPVSGLDKEARVLRYREKRKNRKFNKTIRYASRKAYAETRPRIKGRFAKRSDIEVESLIAADASYGVVPTF